METITIEGMDEHDFRFSIEDMLRLGKVDEAVGLLRGLLEPCVGDDAILPSRFLRVSSSDLEFAGWERLADRLYNHDRPTRPISAIGVALADYRSLGGRGPSHGWLAPFIKTFYFSDEAFPFSDATRSDLLDGYTREGFGWHGDYQATDATLSVKGIDDLYGAIVEIENRLMASEDPPLEEIYAGTIGACYLAALIHQSLRATIREKGLPRPLCVLAACDGVFPFFDAPVAGLDECMVAKSDVVATDKVGPDEFEGDGMEGEQEPTADLPGEASLLDVVSRRGTKTPVIALDEEESRQSALLTEKAGAQRMLGEEATVSEALQQGFPVAERTDSEEPEDPLPDEFAPSADETLLDLPPVIAMPCCASSNPADLLEMEPAQAGPHQCEPVDGADRPDVISSEDLHVRSPIEGEDTVAAEEPEAVAMASPGHALRRRIGLASQDERDQQRGWQWAIVGWFRRLMAR